MNDLEIRMIKPQHDSQGKRLPDPGERRGSHMRSLRTSTRKVMKIRDRIYGRNMTLIGFVQLDSKQQFFFLSFFDTTRHKETWAGLAVKLWGSTSCACVNSSVKHTRVRKYQLKHVI